MSPMKAYKQQQQPTSWPRIDLLLALYEGAIERLNKALPLLRAGDETAARHYLARVQGIVLELAAGINLEVNDPASVNLLRLYEFFVHATAGTDPKQLEAVLRSLTTLRDGFREIRRDAVELERTGAIPACDSPRMMVAMG